MKLAKRVTLHYQAGNSNKVYEVDLCQISDDKYLVNFRYGKRGKNLKEGSKTIQAVSLVEAEKIFDKLIADKKKKGYQDINDVVTEVIDSPQVNTTSRSNNPRHQAIIDRLREQNSKNWSLNRVIWRAGELKIKEVVPFLIDLIGTEKPLRDYCIAWALGKCGEGNADAITELNSLVNGSYYPEFVNRIAWEALYNLSNEQGKQVMRSQKISELPLALRELAQNGTTKIFKSAIQAYLKLEDYRRFKVIDTLYQIDNEYVRPALLDIVREAPLQPNYFKQLRHIFKMAEYRGDGEVFGILAHRFELQAGNFNNPKGWGGYNRETRRVIRSERIYSQELQKPDSNKAYSEQTREYLRRRVWRTLKTLGEENEPDYVKLATGILLSYSDADEEEIKESRGTKYRYNKETRRSDRYTYHFQWDKYATRIILNHLLYQNSPRYESHPQAWRCTGDYKLGDSLPTVREEAFPQLWNQQPSALLRLLQESKCLPVHEFALKAIQENQEYCHSLEIATLTQLLDTTYEITAQFAFNLACEKYDSQAPNREFVLAVANCILSTARQQAYEWIEAQREYFFEASEFIAGLVTSLQDDTRAFARKLLSSTILNDATVQVLIIRLVGILLELDETQPQMAEEISETLLLSFTPQLRTLGFDIILDLLAHPLPEIQVLGARILLNHQTPAIELPSDLIESLLSSPHDSVRSVGIRIFGQLPDERLMDDDIFIIAMAVNYSSDIRQAIRPVIERLAQNQPEFGYQIAIDLIDLLTEPERHEGVHKDLLFILRSKMIPNWITRIPVDKTISLTRAKSSIAQELGGIILQANSDSLWSEFGANQLVKFANHEVLAIRQAGWQMMELKLESILNDEDEMLCAVKMLEAKWEDSQEFARSLFDKLDDQDWTPRMMIGVCDSTKENVRRFGRDIVTSNFQEEYGQEYLLKFSEHPSADMQMFVTNYLETYAMDDEERLKQLVPYFVTVLSGVNKGSVAKKRIFQFLETEAIKNEEMAKIVAEVLTRQSVTMAIADKASAIQIMLRIKKQYPEIEIPIRVKEVMQMRC